MTEDALTALKKIFGEDCFSTEPRHNLDELIPAWDRHVQKVRAEAPYAAVTDGGETIFTGELSMGCRACKSGVWDCLFVTMNCNLACPFCCSPVDGSSEVPLSAFGREIGEVIENLRMLQPEGISFSGGEVFMNFDKLRSLAAVIRQAFPRAYLWVYTNGLLTTGEKIAELGEIGIDEIRFNLAASGYRHPGVLRNVQLASRVIENVTVEIPALPTQSERLLEALPEWSGAGVRYLNLHELMYEPGSLSTSLPGPRAAVHTPDGHFSEVHPDSRALTLRVIQAVHDAGLPLAVNDCSMQNKLRQVHGRRRLLGRFLTTRPGSLEAMDENGLLQIICGFDVQGNWFFTRPDQCEKAREEHPGFRFIRLWRLPPLSVYESCSWFRYEEIT